MQRGGGAEGVSRLDKVGTYYGQEWGCGAAKARRSAEVRSEGSCKGYYKGCNFDRVPDSRRAKVSGGPEGAEGGGESRGRRSQPARPRRGCKGGKHMRRAQAGAPGHVTLGSREGEGGEEG